MGLGGVGASRHRRRHQPVRRDAVDALRLGACGAPSRCGASAAKTWRTLAVAYPTVLLVVVLGTGNHFMLDVVAGAACVVAAYGIVTLIGRAMGRTSKQHDPRLSQSADACLVRGCLDA